MRKIIFRSLLFLPFIFLFILVSCQVTIKKKGEIYHNFPMLKKDIHLMHLEMPDLLRKNITMVPNDLSSVYFHTDVLVGGFKELRHIYASKVAGSKKYNFYHAGDDIMLPYLTKIYAPFNGEIVSYVWLRREGNPIAIGLGGQLVMKVKISEIKKTYPKLKLNQFKNKGILDKFVYIGIAHLSKNSLNIFGQKQAIWKGNGKRGKINYNYEINKKIDIKHPYEIKKGQLIAEVGSSKENGGWMTHIHIEIHRQKSFLAHKLQKYILKDNQKYPRYIFTAKMTGSFYISNNQKKLTQKERNKKRDKIFNDAHIVAPNAIFSFYNSQTPIALLKI